MTQEEIRAKRKELARKLAEKQEEINEIDLELRILREECYHPQRRPIADDGVSSEYCPDCGWRIPILREDLG